MPDERLMKWKRYLSVLAPVLAFEFEPQTRAEALPTPGKVGPLN